MFGKIKCMLDGHKFAYVQKYFNQPAHVIRCKVCRLRAVVQSPEMNLTHDQRVEYALFSLDDLRRHTEFLSRQQWNIGYLMLAIQVGLIAYIKLVEKPLNGFEKIGIPIIILATFGIGIFMLLAIYDRLNGHYEVSKSLIQTLPDAERDDYTYRTLHPIKSFWISVFIIGAQVAVFMLLINFITRHSTLQEIVARLLATFDF